MRLSPAGRTSGPRQALIALVIGVLLFSGAPLAAWSAPTPDPTPTESVTAQDESAAKDAKETPAPADEKPSAEKTPSDDESASEKPSAEPTDEAEPRETAEPSEAPEDSESPTGDPSESESATPSATASPSKSGRVVAQVVPPATGNNAVITVKVGGNRAGQSGVTNLAGVQLGFFAAATGGTALFTCTSDVDGDCSITVPNTQAGGANRDARYWVRQTGPASGYYQNTQLGTGTTVAADNYVFETGTQLRNGTIYRSTVDFMVDTGNTNNQASGGIWQNSLANPSFPAKCGINVAILHDLSNSVEAPDLAAMKAASTGFVNALVGTPSQVGTFTFATSAPAAGAGNATLGLTSVSTAAGAATVNARINGMTLPGGAAGGTNWDRGISQVAQSPSAFDVLVVITDGNPTYYGDPVQGPGNRTRFRELENGIFSANAVKAEGTKVLAVGVGAGVTSPASGLNLRSISGQTQGTDYYQTADYAAAGAALRTLALGSCRGSISVVKQVVPSTTATGSIAGAQPQGGWDFTGAGTTGVTFDAPTTRTTATGTGAANFPLTFAGGTTSGTVTLTETPQSGYTLHQGVTGQNAVCTRVDTGATIPPGNVTNGFTVAANSGYPISCIVYNKAPSPLASVVLNKSWAIDGTTYADGNQPTGFNATGQINTTNQAWGVERTGFRQGDVVSLNETGVTAPPQCTVTPGRLTNANGTNPNQALPASQTLNAGLNTYTITNTVTCQTRLTLTKTVQGGTEPVSSWNLDAVAPGGALTGPNGTSGSPGATGAAVSPGITYPLAEAGTTATTVNYVQTVNPNAVLIPGSTGSWSCQEVGTDGSTVIPGFSDGLNGGVTVPLGRWVRCNAVNQTATLALAKIVVNDNGGTAVPADWQLTATPVGTFPPGLLPQTVTGSTTGVSFNVRPGVDYAITEAGPPGYARTDLVCAVFPTEQRIDVVNLRPLDVGVCTFTNNDTPSTLTLVKTVTNDNGGTAAPTAWTLNAGGPTPITGTTGSSAVTNAVVNAGSYNLSETGGPAGYTAGSWSCTGGTLTGASVVVPNGVSVTCTINNNDRPAQLTLVKTVTNDNGGTALATAWTLAAGGPTPITGTTGSGTVTNATVNAGTYTLSETGGPPGYTAGSWTCTGVTNTGATLVLTPGSSATCTINNNDRAANLTLVKTVTNDNGGTALPTAWTLAAAGPTPISGVTGSGPVTGAAVSAGVYTLSETGGPAGYSAEPWTCTGATTDGTTVTVPTGGTVTCTINNNDQAAQLTLVKVVNNGDTGSTAVPSDWTLTAAGPGPDVTGPGNSAAVTAITVDAGSYDLSESGGPAGYTASDWSCSGGILTGASVAVPNGGNVTCTITNTAQPAQLTLVKTVTNDNGGTAAATDWLLRADGPTGDILGPTGSRPVTAVPVSIGDYDLSEAGGPAGYTAGDWTCTGGDQSGSTVSIALGDDVTCTIDNDDQPAQLTLVKVVDNGTTGAEAEPADWTLTATGPDDTITGDGNSAAVTDQTVNAGSYSLAETGGPAGYTPSAWTCTGATVTGAAVVVPNAGDVTCTITNTAVAPTLTLVKNVDNGETGATTEATEWILTAVNGASIITGATGSGPVTAAPAIVGTYDLSEDGPDGYTASDWVCTGATVTTADSVTLDAGQNATCTITNTAQPPTLTLIKTVTNDNGGSALPEDWTLTATGPTSDVTGSVGDPAVTDYPVMVGDYVLSETGGPGGYTPGAWSCTGGTLNGSTVAVGVGEDVRCTINNDDQPAQLTLVKVVDDPDGSGTTSVPADWDLTADPQDIDGQDPVTGNGDPTSPGGINAVEVFAGAYELSEDGPNGFDGSLWECTGGAVAGAIVTIPSGGDVTCTITNTAIAPRLTLVKTVTNDNGGTAVATDWTLAADGPSPISGTTGAPAVTDAAVEIGTYALDEAGPGGYTASDWTCVDGEGASFPVDGASITVAEGDDVTCTIVNNDVLGTWTLAKSSSPASGTTVQPGDEITYTVTATKTGGVNPVNRVVTDDLANVLNNATLVTGPTASTGTAALTGTTLTWDIPSLDGTQTVTYTVRVNADAYGVTLRNAVTGNGSTACTPAAPCTTTHPTPHFTLVKTSDPVTGSTVNPGDTITYTLTATNDSDAVLTGAVVTDDLSDVLDNAAIGTVGAGGSLAGTTLTWTVPTIDPGGQATLTYDVEVNAGAYDETIGNVATPGPGGECVQVSDCTTTHPTPHYVLTKTSDPTTGSTVNPGDTITYTLTATNDSDGVVTGAVVTDDLASVLDNATLGTVSAGGSVTGTTLTWSVPTIQPGANATVTYTVTVNQGAYGVSLRNVATPGPGGDCQEPNDCTTTHPTPRYTLVKSSTPGSGITVSPGDTITYTLTADNVSDAPLIGGRVTDNLADVLDNATFGAITGGSGGSLTGTTLTWNIPDLPSGDQATLTYTVIVDADAYNVTIGNVATPGPAGECVEADDCTTTHPTPHWVINKTSDPASGSSVEPGETVTYTLTALNDSDGTVRTATATDDLSDVLDNATLNTVGAGGTVTGTTLTWAIPELAAGERATLSYTVTVAADAYNQTLHNVVTPGAGGDCRSIPVVQPESAGAAAVRPAALVTAQAAVDCETTHYTPGWSLEKRSDPKSGSEVDPGDQVTYTLTVTNTSAAVVDSAVVTDDLSSVLEYASLDSVPAGAALSGTTLTWNVPTLQSGETAELSYTVTVDDDAYDVSFANVATPGNGGECTLCTTYHVTPPAPDNPDEPKLPNTGGTSLVPLGLGAGFLITGALLLAESRRRRQPVRVRIDPKR